MLARPDTYQSDFPPLESVISLPYTLTPGRAAGVFLAEMGNRRIIGSRFKNSGKVCVPAEDFCPETCDSEFEFVQSPETGTLQGFTETAHGVIGSIRMDGADFDFPHQIIGSSFEQLNVGDRVRVIWADEPVKDSIMTIAGFELSPDAPIGELTPSGEVAPQVEVVPYALDFHYEHAFGPYYGRMFDEIKNNRRIMGVKCPAGDGAYLPPRETCDVTHKRTGTWVDIKDTGVVRGMSVIHMEFVGQKLKPPYIYAEIKLDGASTRLIHIVKIDDMDRAKELVKPGTRVKAVWSEKATGSMNDIEYFEVIDS